MAEQEARLGKRRLSKSGINFGIFTASLEGFPMTMEVKYVLI